MSEFLVQVLFGPVVLLSTLAPSAYGRAAGCDEAGVSGSLPGLILSRVLGAVPIVLLVTLDHLRADAPDPG